MGLQIFGTKKCQLTRKAERFFRDRNLDYQFIDLSEKAMSRGEILSVLKALGGDPASLVDYTSKAAVERGLAHLETDLVEELVANPLLLRTPVVRNGAKATVGDDPAGWKALA